VSFGVLAAGQVESFRQFGWIGGVGIFACWLASFTVLPAALVIWDRQRVYPPRPRRRSWWSGAPRRVLIGCALLTAGSAAAMWVRRNDALETNLGNLGMKSSLESGLHALDRRLRAMDPGSSTPAVIPAASREEARQICEALQPIIEATQRRFMQHCWMVDVLLPQQVEVRRPLLRRFAAHLDQVPLALLDEGDRRELTRLKTLLAERAPDVGDLPRTLVEPFVERDGSIGKLAFVDPVSDEVAENLFAFADSIRELHLPSGKVIHASGENVVFSDVLRAVSSDAKRLTLAAAIAVLLVLALVTRRLRSFARVALVLFAGVVWMVGAAALLGQKLNFFNFVALPTTFGIGIDYAINVDERLRLSGWSALAEVAPPVALASATTLLGYLSLLYADNQALASFGRLAILGEVTTLAAALVMLPALWGLKVAEVKPAVGRNRPRIGPN
jgi:uncharacterized protein